MDTSSLLIRILTFITLCMVWYFGSMLIAIPLSIWYLYNFRAYELLVLGVAIDAHFLSEVSIPYYTLGFFAVIVFMEVLKPSLRKNDII
jgi:hypothetical protein